MKKIYCVSLSQENVQETKMLFEEFGGKLSTLLNKLLKEWVESQKQKEVNIQ